MAKNGKKGGGRVGAIRSRTQFKNPATGVWVKRNSENGQFMDVKADPKPFKGVRRENK